MFEFIPQEQATGVAQVIFVMSFESTFDTNTTLQCRYNLAN